METNLQNPKAQTLEDYLRTCIDRPLAERPALVVEGGGMRGVYSITALAVLEEMGLREAFSMVIGSSAGALNGAYFLSGQAKRGIGTYVDDLSNKNFVNPRRLKKIVDIDFMVDNALHQQHPLNIDALKSAPGKLHIILTNAETAESKNVVIDDQSEDDIYELFRATSALPVLYGKAVTHDDGKYIDCGVANQVPVNEAWRLGASEAIVVLTRCAGHRRHNATIITRALLRMGAPKLPEAIKSRLIKADEIYNQTMDDLDNEQSAEVRKTWTLRPTDKTRLVGLSTSDRPTLIETARLAREDMQHLLRSRH